MYSRKTRRNSRRRTGSRAALRVSLVAAGACAPVLVIGYAVATTHGGHAADTADVSVPSTGTGAGGWGRGGYTMMPGPAGSASPAQGNSATTAPAANAAATTSANWAGYAATGNQGTFTNVSASWTQPTVTCGAANTFSSFWVGLDGDGTPTVEQTGTEADCNAGTAVYQGWFEMFPNAPVFYNNPVVPGDAMSASVVANGGGAFTLTLTDATQNWTQTTNQTSGAAQLGSAEVIAEAPSNGTVLPLSNFGTVSFANATADNVPIGNENAAALTMVSAANNVTEATPSALTGANAFTVTWDSSGASTAAPAPTATTATPAPPASSTSAPSAGTSTPMPSASASAPAATPAS
jgi:Peptidase A4 family